MVIVATARVKANDKIRDFDLLLILFQEVNQVLASAFLVSFEEKDDSSKSGLKGLKSFKQ